MKELIRALALGTAILSAATAEAGEPKDIHLKDGSTIKAEVLSVRNGVYVLYSPTFGTLQLDESQIESLGGAAPLAGDEGPSMEELDTQIKQLRNEFMADPDFLRNMQSLREDRDFERVLNDPELMDAVRRGDIQRLMDDPAIRDLTDHPAVKGLSQGR